MKLIATDLDGTLLNEMGKVSKENSAAIQHALNQEIEVVVATGRAYGTAAKELKKAGLNLPIIGLNGAVLYTTDEQATQSIPLDKKTAREIANTCQNLDVYFEVFTDKGVFSTSKEYFTQVIIDIVQSSNPEVSEEAIKQQIEARFIDENVQFTTDYDTVFNKQMIQVYKILVFSPDEKKLSEIRALYQQDETLAVTSSAKINLEINHIDAQKGKAIENYAHSKGIDMQDVLAIGDNDNDISMLKKAGKAVVMENAADEIKQYADFITKKNDEHGFAYAIQKALKGQI